MRSAVVILKGMFPKKFNRKTFPHSTFNVSSSTVSPDVLECFEMESKEVASKLLRFIHGSPSPYHAVEQCTSRLKKAGFEELLEREEWPKLVNGGKYYFTRNLSSIVAFAVGGKYVREETPSL